MANKRRKREEIVTKLRQVDVLVGQGMVHVDAIRQVSITEQTYYRWCKQYGARYNLDQLKEPLRFNDFEREYNYAEKYQYNHPFYRILRTLLGGHDRPCVVLDIGCGEGIGQDIEMQREIAKLADELWGVEPDPGIEIDSAHITRLERATLQEANLPSESIDIAYAFMVMEHVQDPASFLRKVAKLLKSGGVFLFATPNARHLFGLASYWTCRLGIEEKVLRMIRTEEEIDEYHHPLAYRINTERQVRAAAATVGLDARIGYCEAPSGMTNYLRGALKPIYWGLIAKRLVWRRRSSLCHIYGLLEKTRR